MMKSHRDAVYVVAAPEVKVGRVTGHGRDRVSEREKLQVTMNAASHCFPGMLTIALLLKMNESSCTVSREYMECIVNECA